MMKTIGFVKGMGIGLIAGAAVTAAVIPIDRRRFMRSKAGKVVRSIGNAVESVTDTFH